MIKILKDIEIERLAVDGDGEALASAFGEPSLVAKRVVRVTNEDSDPVYAVDVSPSMSWKDASAMTSRMAGGWRLPTVKELDRFGERLNLAFGSAHLVSAHLVSAHLVSAHLVWTSDEPDNKHYGDFAWTVGLATRNRVATPKNLGRRVILVRTPS